MPSVRSTLIRFYDELLAEFGQQHWWPGDTRWEIATGAVLTQNTNWRNVEKAIENLKVDNALLPQRTLSLSVTDLANLIQPSGFFNVKAKRLRNLATWWLVNSELAESASSPLKNLRADLLSVNGVGEETADSILLYAFDRRSFVVDAYTRRFLQRHGLIDQSWTYQRIKSLFEKNIPDSLEIYKEYHALIVILGKTSCRTKPACDQCPLRWHLQ